MKRDRGTPLSESQRTYNSIISDDIIMVQYESSDLSPNSLEYTSVRGPQALFDFHESLDIYQSAVSPVDIVKGIVENVTLL